MDLFRNASAVRLKSVHGKYLIADDDEESVYQDRDGSSKSAKWRIEFVEDSADVIRLKSCYGKYLAAFNRTCLLGVTGHKVLQTLPKRLDSSLEWEPIKDHGNVKLKTRYGHFLRAKGGLPPWRNSITHDVPHRTATQGWVLWQIHVVDILVVQSPQSLANQDSVAAKSDAPTASQSSKSPSLLYRQESIDSVVTLPSKADEGRLVYFQVVNEAGEVDEEFEEQSIKFKGTEVHQLTQRLEEELGTKGITVCSRSPLNGKLCPLHLQLPPHNATMHVVVIPPSSKGSCPSVVFQLIDTPKTQETTNKEILARQRAFCTSPASFDAIHMT